MRNSGQALYQSRIRVAVILMFASAADLLTSLFAGQSTGGFILNFLALGSLFVVQETFRPIQLIFAGILSLFIFYAIAKWSINFGPVRMMNWTLQWVTNPALRPLTIAIIFTTIIIYRLKRKYDFTR
jgi:ABC-type Fe3+-siderophore transport system permease subunit